MRQGLLFVISGPAGSGKGTVVNALLNNHPELKLSISATTRSPRPGEAHGVHYYYISKEEFEARIEKGETIPGWRTQARRGRIWARDIREAEGGVEGQARALAQRLGAAPDDFVTQSLKTPAQMAKTLPKETLADVTEETATTALVSTGGQA
jgi:hypothetical protein